MESRLDAQWREVGGFWEEESRSLGMDDEEVRPNGGLDEVFAEIGEVRSDNVA